MLSCYRVDCRASTLWAHTAAVLSWGGPQRGAVSRSCAALIIWCRGWNHSNSCNSKYTAVICPGYMILVLHQQCNKACSPFKTVYYQPLQKIYCKILATCTTTLWPCRYKNWASCWSHTRSLRCCVTWCGGVWKCASIQWRGARSLARKAEALKAKSTAATA